MCGRFVQKSERKIITEEFYVQEFLDDVFISYNVAPGQNAGVITNDGKNRYALIRWGLVPSWADDIQIGYKMINARAETVSQKPSFRSAFSKRRCLIPADGFYEWKKEGSFKVPFYIYNKSENPISLAGLWETWNDPEGNPLKTFTIITTEANDALKDIHSRMPVIIPPEKRSTWLDPEMSEKDRLLGLLIPYGKTELVSHKVSRIVNSPKNNSPECVRPVSDMF